MKTVLLVEDLKASAAIIAQKICNIGGAWDITTVHTLGAALKELRSRAFDLVVLDLALPDSGGIYTFKKVKPHAGTAPVIILTVTADQETQKLAEGAFAYLVKGEFTDQEFSDIVQSAVGGPSFMRENDMEKISKNDNEQEIEVSSPLLGRFFAKGVRTSEIIGLLTLCLVGTVLFFVLKSYDISASQKDITAKRYSELGAILKNQVASQKLMTCIISMPQERREQEYSQPNSFCRRMAESQ